MAENKRDKAKQEPGHTPTTNSGRRRLLQALSIGGVIAGSRALPEKWARPVVDAVVLPTHAQTSPQGGSRERWYGDTLVTDVGFGRALRRSLSDATGLRGLKNMRLASAAQPEGSLLDYFIRPAAATEGGIALVEASVEDDGDCTVGVTFKGILNCEKEDDVEFEFNLCFRGKFGEVASEEETGMELDCPDAPPDAAAVIDSVDDVELVLLFAWIFGEIEITLVRSTERPTCRDCRDEKEDFLDLVDGKKCDL